jgi:selenocysteine lyase/cysteine desulfurase
MSILVHKEISLEKYFGPFRDNVIGNREKFISPYGEKEIIYADWTASGRLYRPIEKIISDQLGPYVGNTHTETTVTGTAMTKAYHKAHKIIKSHVNASSKDVIITTDSGMTGVVNKFQRILGLKIPENLQTKVNISDKERPVVFVTHMEHHSNHTSWLETMADVECIMPSENGLINLNNLETLLNKYADRETKIASITACSNVTGIHTDYHAIARVVHQHGGLCFVDFACSAPYEKINMHPENPEEKLDAIYFSPHKFLGGPGSTGVLIFDSILYKNRVPDQVGGGTVAWTNPWGEHKFFDDIEIREDGGTPAFLQTVKAALAIKLKEKMGIERILEREKELVERVFQGLTGIESLHIMAGDIQDRLAVISFYIDDFHYNLVVKLLNDRFGIQTRGGCSCAGTYGHYLLHIPRPVSHSITSKIDHGHLEEKPGWVRMSLHPVMTNEEVDYILDAIKLTIENKDIWSKDYVYNSSKNEFYHKNSSESGDQSKKWFDPDLLD